ncbi:MAG TPA: DUF5671 domain-containing protein [Actinomycetota bacterium]
MIGQLYYYLAALIGVGFLLGGAIAGLLSLRDLILPGDFTSSDEAIAGMLHGLTFVLIGVACLWWHLREARRREERPHREVFWGRSLYFHLVAALSLGFVLTGLALSLNALVELVVPRCGVADGGCFPSSRDDVRLLVNGGIVLLVSGPVWFWHLRQGRALTRPA